VTHTETRKSDLVTLLHIQKQSTFRMILHRLVLFVSQFFLFSLGAAAMTRNLVIDSHLHVWASQKEAETSFPYAEGQVPPESLRDAASKAALLKKMGCDGSDNPLVDGALIVQPINHKFDHSYVMSAIKEHPDRFKGMLLHDPSLSPEEAVDQLENLAIKGFVGVRFNPYLWPKTGDSSWTPMSSPDRAGLAVFRRCAELKMPVGVMCFQGLQLHYDDIVALMKASPDTTLILDHFGFTSFTPEGDGAFQKLLKLAEYPQVVVKISALFRLQDTSPFERVRKERFEPLLASFGADRLMFGTDFPFVTEQEPEKYEGTVKLVASWMEDKKTRDTVMGGTAERLFGPWGAKMG
jgi:predicted TIM-barrel fold metal-dependent hydrolase